MLDTAFRARICVLLMTFVLLVLSNVNHTESNSSHAHIRQITRTDNANKAVQNNLPRTKRGLFNKNGFLRTLFAVTYEQWVDTKNTINTVNKMINENFLDENAPVVEVTTSSDPNATTTEAPFKISRAEFNRIVRRNIKGIARLLNLELRDAFKQSQETEREFKKNASAEVSKYL